MNYLFFDVECANCFDGKGKIYSIGYVLVDENFKVISTKDILINPDVTKWDWYVLKNFLGYDKKEVESNPKFDARFDEVKSLLEYPDTLIVGFAFQNDIKFLSCECSRYNLKMPNFKYVDLYNVIKTLEKREVRSLSNEFFNYTLKFTNNAHRSDEDAFLTMQIFKELKNKHDNLFDEINTQSLLSKDYVEPSEKRKRNKELQEKNKKIEEPSV